MQNQSGSRVDIIELQDRIITQLTEKIVQLETLITEF
jgi:hypothetical protein